MRFSPFHFFRRALPFVLGLLVLVGLVVALIEVGVLQYAYEKLGVSRRYVFPVLALSLLGSYVNILSVGVSAGVGLVFGIYPGTRAARLDPVEALRYE